MATRGGSRPNAGRKTGSSAFKESTVVKRVPQSLVSQFDQWLSDYKQILAQTDTLPPNSKPVALNAPQQTIPLALESVQAGFPSPAAPYIADHLDFNEYLVSNPSATIGVFSSGESMIDIGIEHHDLLVVDRSLEPHHRDIVLVELDNEFTVKRLIIMPSGIELHPENSTGKYPIIKPKYGSIMNLIGVVTFNIKKMR